MNRLFLHPTAIAQWHSLVLEAEQACAIHLQEELQSYLVFLLMRFLSRVDLANSVLAVEFLQTIDMEGQVRYNKLRDLGDKCLLFSGLFPERAERRRVKISYFVDLGQSAYDSLATVADRDNAILFGHLAHHFVKLMEVLHAIREFHVPINLSPLQAVELWEDTGSEHLAKQCLDDKKNTVFIIKTTKRLQ